MAAVFKQWFVGGVTGKKMLIIGDSTSDGAAAAPALYVRLAIHGLSGGLFEGVTIVDHGQNGQTAAGFITDPGAKGLASAISAAADLYVISYGINDVRLGACDAPTLVSRISTIVNSIRAAVPSADIVLRMPNSLLATNVEGANYVSPNESAQAYSYILRDAYRALENVWPNVVLLDTQSLIFGETALASSSLMVDQLHPSGTGFHAIADLLATVAGYSIPFDSAAAAAARASNYTADYTVYFGAVRDTNYYDLIADTTWNSSGVGYLYVNWPGARATEILIGDICAVGSNAPFVLTSAGGNLDATRTFFSMTPPQTSSLNGIVKFYRHKFGHSLAIQSYCEQPSAYPYRWRGTISAGGSGFIDLSSRPSELIASSRTATVAADTLIIFDQAPILLTGGTFSAAGNSRRILKSGTYSGNNGKVFFVFGNHPFEDASTTLQPNPAKPSFQIN